MADATSVPTGVEWPLKADLRKDVSRPLPIVAPGTVDPASMSGDIPTLQAKKVIEAFNCALASNDAEALADCFYAEQAFWRDIVALTSHLRTFTDSGNIASALLETTSRIGISGKIDFTGKAHFAVINPVMMFIECGIEFRTVSPALNCTGKIILLPFKPTANGDLLWKIWVLSTWVESLVDQPEDESLLSTPGRDLNGDTIETDVIIVGAGTSGLMTAARLKSMGVDCIIVDRDAGIGDNWDNRYDCLEFHVPSSNCEMPFLPYRKELYTPHRLKKYEVAEHMREYVARFHLNVVLSASITRTTYDRSGQKWSINISTPNGKLRTISSRQFVQATGLGSGLPRLPIIKDRELYQGVSIHSVQYSNAQVLEAQGVKSVAVIGSANTAFDVIQDCHRGGLKTTMVARSPTYIFPYDYVMDPHALGAYDALPVHEADTMLNTFPTSLDGQFSHGLFSHLASQEPDRYLALSKAGFPVLDSRHPDVNLQHNLFERGGGHYVDVGGTELIANGEVAVRGLVEPIGFTETGLRLSDGTTLNVDAIVWCTGFADTNVKAAAAKLLGANDATVIPSQGDDILGPEEIAARLDATWGVDAEGEVRGVWKRHLRMDNYWVIGGGMQFQRWWSRALTQQIKMALNGSLPPAYRATPGPRHEASRLDRPL